MKKIKKSITLILCAALAVTMLFGCAPAPQNWPENSPKSETGVFSLAAAESATAPTEPGSDSVKQVDGELSIQFIDVGQADAALIGCEGEYMLVDGGNAPDSDIIYTVLKRNGIDHLKYVIGTHAHEDHIGGLPGAFQIASVDTVFCPVTEYDSKAFENFKAGADRNGGIVIPSMGDTYELGGPRSKSWRSTAYRMMRTTHPLCLSWSMGTRASCSPGMRNGRSRSKSWMPGSMFRPMS